MKRGDEEEDAVFTSRARLYRFDGKEWKERGVGELKMLRNRRSGKVRLLMRRDQVLKICCNHFLSADMTLHPMASSDRAWTWFTSCDFSEGEARAEKLAAKFKNAELAQKFKEAFEKFQRPYSPPRQTEPATDTPSAPSKGGKPVTAEHDDFVTELAATLESAGVSPQTPPRPLITKETDKVKTAKSEESTPLSRISQVPVVAKTTDEVIITKVEEAAQEQQEMARKFQLPKNFYLYLTRQDCPGCRGCTDSFNAADSSTDLTIRPRRRTAPDASDQELNSPAPGPFGRFVGMSFTDFTKGMSSTFNWMVSQDSGGFKSGGQIFGRLEKGDEDDGGEGNPEEEADIHFTPVATLPETYEVKRGDEEEDAVFTSRARLYRFDGKEWKERGVGELKMLRNRRSGKVRLLMRRDQVLKICCNHFLSADMTLHPMASSDRAWTWFTSCDFSEGESRAEKLAARFKNAELAQKFKEAFVEAQKYILGPPELVDDAEENSAAAIPDLEEDSSVAADDLERPPTPPKDEQMLVGTHGGYRQPTVYIPPTTSHKAPSKHPDQVPIPGVGEWECMQCKKWNPALELWCVSCKCPIGKNQVEWRGTEGIEGAVEGGDTGRLPPKDWSATSSNRNPFFNFPRSLLPATSAAGQQPEPQSESLFNQLMTQTTIMPSPSSAILNSMGEGEQQVEEMGRKEGNQSIFGQFAVGSLPTLESLASKNAGSRFGWLKEGGPGFSTGTQLFSTEKRDKDDTSEVNPEEEADIHFTPVVSLPETYKVKRGDEEEDAVFTSRAKLYRHDGKEWKERGVGELKMLRNRRSGKVRLLMRRDQVLKICCNHFLSADMTLHPMASSDRAWTWFTSCDFSEGEARAEKLAARFKNAELAQKFKEAFETNARRSAAPQSAVKKEPTQESRLPTLKLPQPSNDSWSCSTCLVENDAHLSTCPCCGTTKPGVKQQAQATVGDLPSQGPGATQQGVSSTLSFPELPLQTPLAGGMSIPFPSSQPPAGGMSIPFPSSQQPAGGMSIPFPSTQPPAGGMAIPFPSSQPHAKSGLPIQFPEVHLSTSGGQTLPHSSVQPQLALSGVSGVQLASSQSEVLSSDLATDEVEIVKVEVASSEQVRKARKFMLPDNFYLFEARPPCSGCRGCTDNFDGRDEESARDKKRREKKQATWSVSAQQESDLPGVLSVTGGKNILTSGLSFTWIREGQQGFSSGSQLFGSLGQSHAGDPGEDNEANPEEEADIHFKPVATLPETYEVKRGDEEEDAVFTSRAKLYRFDGKEWKERGVGELKMLRNRRSGKVRLLMRRDQVLKICCNHFLSADMTLHPMASSDRAWTWFTSCDFSEGESRAEKLAARFKNAELAQKFKEAFVEAQKYILGPPELVDDAEENSATAIPDLEEDLSVTADDLERPPTPPKDRQMLVDTHGGDQPQPEEPVLEEPQPEEPQPVEPQPEEHQPEEPQPEEPQPEEPQPEEPQPVEPRPEEPRPEEPQPEEPQPVEPQPEEPQPEEPQPEEPQPVEPQPEEPQPEDPQPEDPQPEEPQPEEPQPEEPQPVEPQPEEPQPEEPQPEEPQPEEPQPVEPQPEEPQPEEPQPEEPQPVEPQPEEPQPEEPQPEEPQPEEPQPEEPQPEEPQPEEPQPEEPQPEEPQPVEPQPEEPQPVEPQPEDPQPEEPQPEEPQPEEPQPEEPQPEEPQLQEQKLEDPESDGPEKQREPQPEEPQPEEPEPKEPQKQEVPEPEETQKTAEPQLTEPQPEEPHLEETQPDRPQKQEESQSEVPQKQEVPQSKGIQPEDESKPEKPQPEEPQLQEQKLEDPESDGPEKKREPEPEEPQPEEPQPEEPQPEEPQPEEPQPEEPQKQEVPEPEETQKTAEPQPTEPQPKEPQPEEPEPKEPQPEEPQPEEPQPEEPQKQEVPEPEETQKTAEPQPTEPQPKEPQPEEPEPKEPQKQEVPEPEETQKTAEPQLTEPQPEEPHPEETQPDRPQKQEESHSEVPQKQEVPQSKEIQSEDESKPEKPKPEEPQLQEQKLEDPESDGPEKQEAPQPEETQRPAEPQQTESQPELTEGPQKSEDPQQETLQQETLQQETLQQETLQQETLQQEILQQDKPQLQEPREVVSQCEMMPQQAPVEHSSLPLPHTGQQGSAQVPGQGDVSNGKLTELPEATQVARREAATPAEGEPPRLS